MDGAGGERPVAGTPGRNHIEERGGDAGVSAAGIRSRSKQWLLAACAGVALIAPSTALAESPVQPYGTNDAGYPNAGFRNVLPPGENGLDNGTQLAEFQASKAKKEPLVYPAHFKDQLPLYANLIYGSPTLTHEHIRHYFNGITFGLQRRE